MSSTRSIGVDEATEPPPSRSAHRGARYVVLDGWRGIAALALAVFHLQVSSHIYFVPLVRHAYLFVDFFFLLSGFVIAHAYAGRIRTVEDVSIFIVRRFGRLYPLHICVLAMFVAAELAVFVLSGALGLAVPRPAFSHDRTASTILVNVLLLNGIGLTEGATWNGPSWSISAEFFVYLLFGATMLLPTKLQPALAAALCFGALGVLIAFSPGFEVCNRFALFRCLLSFFLGTLLWRVRDRFVVRHATALELLAVALVLAFVWFAASGPVQLLAPVPFGLLVYVFAQQKGRVSGWMARPTLQHLGRLSYSIYMVHYFLAFGLTNILKTLGGLTHHNVVAPDTDLVLVGNRWVMDVVTLLYLAIVVLLSDLAYAKIEQPGIAFFKDWIALRQATRLRTRVPDGRQQG